MVTRLKPQRVKSSNSPQVGQNLWYEDSNNFKWQDTWSGVWDMKYSDFQWQTLTWNAITIEDISNNITPSSNFTVSAGTVKPGIEYVLRVNTGNTAYTMTLWTGVTNPNGYSTDLQPNTVNQFTFIATSNNQLELEWNAWGMTILSYGNSTWSDFISAYNKNAIVYCRASSNSNPATWSQTRLAFMAYVNNADTPTEVEFQYYRSRSSHSTAQTQQDEVYVYKLTSSWTWTVTARDTATRITTGTWLTNSYTTSSWITTMTIANDGVLTVNGANGTVTVNDIKQSATAPANPTAWTAWYDTTNGVLKVYNGTAWDNIATGGAISDTAYWPGWDGQTTTAPSQNAVYDKISSIDALIPSEATSSNKLADKNFVGDSINSVTAYYITKNAAWDQWSTRAELFAATTFYSGGEVRVPTKNDYTIVLSDEQHDNATTRYIYNNGWEYQYTVNETAMTQAQLNALNSGITAWKVSTYDWYATGKQDTLVSGTNIKTVNNQSLLWSGDISINWILSGPLVPAASATYAGRIWFDTTNNIFWKCDWTSWEAIETNTKTFQWNRWIWYFANAQAVYDRISTWKYAIVEVRNVGDDWKWSVVFWPTNITTGTISSWEYTHATQSPVASGLYYEEYMKLVIEVVNWVVTQAYDSGSTINNTGHLVVKGDTAPSNPIQWSVWYDKINKQLKIYDGTNWNQVGWWLQESPNSTITGIKYIRHWTEVDYANLSQYYTDVPGDTEFHTF